MPHPVTPVSLTFRKALPADVPSILKLVRSAYRGESSRTGWTTEADLVADERIDEAGVLRKIAEPNGVILLAHDEAGALASCCEVLKRDDGDLAYFGLFAVDPLRQAGGIGRQVLARAEEHAREVFGVKRLEMWVIWTREELIEWYVRRGYTKTEETVPFPYKELVNGEALRDDLHFRVLVKDL
ncbi:unnamed protein product [Clonostachys chloroleuca]|uniref:N-acetyltransferase domain-containing protein n=1 Tax=Clonostachys chloroleuca TaxID=1926264 RepID=A0AA35QCT2_9HYPO|nr:unnamed protein product [Clonostachys chloroleuca]